MVSNVEKSKILFCLSIVGPIVTLAVTPSYNFDPINPVKVLALSTLSFSMIGIFVTKFKRNLSAIPTRLRLLYLFFLLSIFIPVFFTKTNLEQQVWGVFGRQNGMLTYTCLIIVLFFSTLMNPVYFSKSLLKSIEFTVVVFGTYCFIQLASLDPFKWSAFGPFGTLGNINFSSALLGILSVALVGKVLSKDCSKAQKIRLVIILTLVFYLLTRINSSQGLLIMVLGLWIFAGVYIYGVKSRFKLLLFTLLSFFLSALGILGFADKGILRSYLYQDTNVFRLDYWNAAIKMIERSPIVGLGFEAYDDWYTTERGIISALRTSLNRNSNSAHNIYLDMAVNAGVIHLILYFVFILISLTSALRYLKNMKFKLGNIDYEFVGLFSAWIAYLAQCLISINQIGISIWGWLLTGLLASYSRLESENAKIDLKGKKGKVKDNRNQLAASSVLSTFIFAIAGFLLAYFPFTADHAWRKGSDNRNLNEMIAASEMLGSNSFLITSTLDLALKNNFIEPVKEISNKLTVDYPRNLFNWRVRAGASFLDENQRNYALQKVREIDPYFACSYSEPSVKIKEWFLALETEKQIELLSWWGIVPRHFVGMPPLGQEVLEAKFASFCGQ